MRRILNIVHHPFWAGPHNRIHRLAGPLRARGWHSMVVLPDRPTAADEVAERHRRNDVETFQMPLRRARRATDVRTQLDWAVGLGADIARLRRLIREARADVVVIGGLINPQGGLAARLARAPLIWQITDTATPLPVVRIVMPLADRLADVLMFDGELVRRWHVKDGAPRTDWCDYLPPVDTDLFAPSQEHRYRTRELLGIPQESVVVGMVANINPAKGIDNFVRCAAAVLRTHPDTRFVSVGATLDTHAGYAAEIRRLVVELGVDESRFIFAGGQSDVHTFYPAFDLKVISSVPQSEGTTTTGMEAAACGVPVIAADIGAVREVVGHEETGLVVPAQDIAALAGAVRRLINEPSSRQQFGERALKRALMEFDAGRSAEVHERAFLHAMRCRGKPVG